MRLVKPTQRATIAAGDQKTSLENSDRKCVFLTTRDLITCASDSVSTCGLISKHLFLQ